MGTSNNVIADEFGFFELKVSSLSESISLRYLGYNPEVFIASELNSVDCSNIFLTPQIESLSEIILRDFVIQGIDKVADGTFNINFRNFGVLPGLIETDVLQTIQALPGVASVSETVSDINIRGGTNDQNLILWDGIKVYQSGHFFGLISIFNPQMTVDAQLIKNGTKAEFSDGVSGTIDMRTDDKINNKFSANLGINFINFDAMLDIPLSERSSIQIASRKAINDFIDTPTFTKYFERIEQDTEIERESDSENKFDFYDASLRWLYRPSEKDFIKLSGFLVNNQIVFNESATVDQIDISKESELSQETFAGGLFYKRNWNQSLVTSIHATGSKYTIDAVNANISDQQALSQKNTIEETAIKTTAFYQLNENFSLEGGYQFTEIGITNFSELDRPPFLLSVKEVIREHGLYSELGFISNEKKTFVNLGARYSLIDFLNDPTQYRIEPRLSIQHKFLENFTFEILGEFKHQTTAQIIRGQNDFLGIERRRWILLNNEDEDIPILTSKQLSIGLSYSKKGWLASVDAYFKEVDGISALSQGFVNQYANVQSIGSYEVTGLEVLLRKRFSKINTWLTYTFANNDYRFSDLDPVQFPNNVDIKHSVGFGASYKYRNFKLSSGFNWHSGLPTTLPNPTDPIENNTINYEAANSSRLKNYLRFDISASYDFKISDNTKASTGISVWNVTNNNNIIRNYFQLRNNELQEIRTNALALTPNFVFRVAF